MKYRSLIFRLLREEALEMARYEPELSFEMQPVALALADELYEELLEESVPIRHQNRWAKRYRPSRVAR